MKPEYVRSMTHPVCPSPKPCLPSTLTASGTLKNDPGVNGVQPPLDTVYCQVCFGSQHVVTSTTQWVGRFCFENKWLNLPIKVDLETDPNGKVTTAVGLTS